MFGGQGYIEDTGLPAILRDAQVLSIWEGTTNVQSADFLRVLVKSRGDAFVALGRLIDARCDDAALASLRPSAEAVKKAGSLVKQFLHQGAGSKEGADALEKNAREFLMSTGRVVIASILIEHAQVAG